MGSLKPMLVVLVLAAAANAHGGAFRPPPHLPVRDPEVPGGGLVVTTRASVRGADPWERWWEYHREELLKVRANLVLRLPVTGPTRPADFFDRKKLREQTIVPIVRVALSDPEVHVRVSAAIAAGKLRDAKSIPALKRMWEHDAHRNVREAAVVGLLLMREPELVGWFHALALDDKSERRLRGIATLALGLLGDVDFLTKLLALDKSRKVRGSTPDLEELQACAAIALGFTKSPMAAGPLLAAATRKAMPRGARGFAAAALGRLGSPLATPELVALVKKPQQLSEARYGAAIALGRLVASSENATIDRLGSIAQRDRDGGVRALIFLSLGRIGGERAATHIVTELKTKEQTVRGFMLLAMGMTGAKEAGAFLLAEWPNIKQAGDRGACALGLALAGHGAAAPIIRKELARRNPTFAPHGLIALGLLRDRAALPLIRSMLKNEENSRILGEGALALALLSGPSATRVLLDLWKSSRSLRVRNAVASALGFVGTARAADALIEMYKSRRNGSYGRALALAALGRIGDPAQIPTLSQFAFDFNPYALSDALRLLVTIR